MQNIPDYANHTLDELKSVVYQHMLKQGTYAQDYTQNYGACRYSVNGNKCAVGLFIPDSLYDPDMERESSLLEDGGRRQPKLWEALKKLGLTSPEKLKFLQKMQVLHDSHVSSDKPFYKYLESLGRFPTSPD